MSDSIRITASLRMERPRAGARACGKVPDGALPALVQGADRVLTGASASSA